VLSSNLQPNHSTHVRFDRILHAESMSKDQIMNRILVLALLAAVPPQLAAQTPMDEVVVRVNQARWDNGQLAPLKANALLNGTSIAHSDAMAVRNFFMHCDPDTNLSASARATNAGYVWNSFAENIAAGSATAAAVMSGWLASSGHRANILSSTVNEIGVGYAFESADAATVRFGNTCAVMSAANGPYRHYWTQNFGRRNQIFPLVIAREAFSVSQCEVDLYVYAGSNPQQMRFRQDAATWSAWRNYESNALWQLNGAAGSSVTITGQVRYANGSLSSALDAVGLNSTCIAELLLVDGFET